MAVEKEELDSLSVKLDADDIDYLIKKHYGEAFKAQYCRPDNDTRRELERKCKAHVEYLNEILSGEVKRCGVCGEEYARKVRKNGTVVYKPACECRERNRAREGVDYTLSDYFEDVLDARYTVDCRGGYMGVRFTLACGGPNIYIDTLTQNIEGYWGGDEYIYSISSDLANAIDDVGEAFYEMASGR